MDDPIYSAGDTVRGGFDTTDPASSSAPATLGGSPVLTVLKDGAAMTLDGGTTALSIDFGTETGHNRWSVDTSNDADFTNGSVYEVRTSGGTIGGVDVAGYVGRFRLEAEQFLVVPSLHRNGANDLWSLAWFRNGRPWTGTFGAATMQVYRVSDGGTHLASGPATHVAGHVVRRSTTTQISRTESYIVFGSANVDSSGNKTTWSRVYSGAELLADVGALGGSDTAAAALKASAEFSPTGTVSGTVTVSGCSASSFTGLTDDMVIGRLIAFLPGGSAGQAIARITDYTSSTGAMTWTPALAAAPTDGDAAQLLGAAIS